jgi:tRNA (guanine-N7-)-methyltransferase
LKNQPLIKSFARRQGRISARQKAGLQHLKYTSQMQGDVLLSGIAKDRFIICEVGFGMGDWLLQEAKKHPKDFYIGIDVYRPGIGSVLSSVHEQEIENIRIIEGDVVEVFHQINRPVFSKVVILFPDPWPKARQSKRRLINSEFISRIETVLCPNGMISIATDNQSYSEQIQDAFSNANFCSLDINQHTLHLNTKYFKKFQSKRPFIHLYKWLS